VNQTLANDIVTRVLASTVQQLTPAGFAYATDPQVLTSSTYRASVGHTAQQVAAQHATANIPPDPQHNQVAAQVMQQVQVMLTQVFDALKVSLTFAIQHGLFTILAFSAVMVLATFLLKDIPLSKGTHACPCRGCPTGSR
jgi:hypothetical protein